MRSSITGWARRKSERPTLRRKSKRETSGINILRIPSTNSTPPVMPWTKRLKRLVVNSGNDIISDDSTKHRVTIASDVSNKTKINKCINFY